VYRRFIIDVEVVTFDELFERAAYIVRDGGQLLGLSSGRRDRRKRQ
jgi:hypothetical protein